MPGALEAEPAAVLSRGWPADFYARHVATVAGFTIDDLETFSRDLRSFGRQSSDMREAAGSIASYFSDNLGGADGNPEAVVVLVHKTHPFHKLSDELRSLARLASTDVEDDTTCLVRLAVAGYEDPDPSPSSLVQPLTPGAFREQPVLEVLFSVMGVDLDVALDPLEAMRANLHHRDLNVFLVQDVQNSELFGGPDQRRQIEELGIRSLLGIGGALPTGDLFFVFMFTRTMVSDSSARLMRSLAPAVKASLVPHALRPFGSPAVS